MKNKNLIQYIFDSKNPVKLIFNMYVLSIFLGAMILSLPISSGKFEFTNFIDALFTATSAMCVTGLSTLTTASHWSIFGKTVIIILIQLGGIGVMTATASFGIIFNKKFSITERMQFAEEKNADSIAGIIKLLKYIFVATFVIEIIGAILLSFTFIGEYGIFKGILYSLFHSISAFCNAGFDIIGDSSLVPYATNMILSLPIMILIILGGIGYGVFIDLGKKKFNFSSYSLHTKIVVIMSVILVFIPTILILIIEWNNPQTIGNMNIFGKINSALFQAITPRTAGFYAIDQASLKSATTIMVIALMFIGGNPAGTAGGFKTTTLVTLFLVAKANIKNEKDMVIFKRRLPEDVARKSVAIFIISLVWIIFVLFALSFTDGHLGLENILYETVSAYATVGLTRGITPMLSVTGKLIISITMLLGKVGPLAMVVAFTKKSFPKSYREAEESIIVG